MGGQIVIFALFYCCFLKLQKISFSSIWSNQQEVDFVKIDDVEKAYKTCLKLNILHLGGLNDTDFWSNTTGFIVFLASTCCTMFTLIPDPR